ncbi:MAG: dephospho-CoA kinase [Proteobacteria bacterium]|nr:dephospho-CoA kinase [Pseudomonadota bacterium]
MSCYAIGLTGGIASGKTAVSDKFAELGCDVIDADVIARNVVKPATIGLSQVVKAFGKEIITSKNILNRAKLKNIVFNDTEKLAQLNSILHPLIKQQIQQEVDKVSKSFCIVVIPLLCESDHYDWLDRTLVVDVKPTTQLARLLTRDNITQKLAEKMIHNQCSRAQRLTIADDVINNEQSLVELHNNVESLYSLYTQIPI